MSCRRKLSIDRATVITLGRNGGPPVERFLCYCALNIEDFSRIYYPYTYMGELEAHFQHIAEYQDGL